MANIPSLQAEMGTEFAWLSCQGRSPAVLAVDSSSLGAHSGPIVKEILRERGLLWGPLHLLNRSGLQGRRRKGEMESPPMALWAAGPMVQGEDHASEESMWMW